MSEFGVSHIESHDRQYPFDRLNLKLRREYGATNYIAWALPGTAEGEDGWQIATFTREAGAPFEVTAVNFAQNGAGKESNAYGFNWTGRAGYTYGA